MAAKRVPMGHKGDARKRFLMRTRRFVSEHGVDHPRSQQLMRRLGIPARGSGAAAPVRVDPEDSVERLRRRCPGSGF